MPKPPKLHQMNLSVRPELPLRVKTLAKRHGWTKRQVVEMAVDALFETMKEHEATAKRASSRDVGDLYRRVARLMPQALANAKVQEGRRTGGDPALIVDEWVIAEDKNGDLMAVQLDGSQVGHISEGEIVVIADRSAEVSEVAALD